MTLGTARAGISVESREFAYDPDIHHVDCQQRQGAQMLLAPHKVDSTTGRNAMTKRIYRAGLAVLAGLASAGALTSVPATAAWKPTRNVEFIVPVEQYPHRRG